jgi:hypothetical protein
MCYCQIKKQFSVNLSLSYERIVLEKVLFLSKYKKKKLVTIFYYMNLIHFLFASKYNQ